MASVTSPPPLFLFFYVLESTQVTPLSVYSKKRQSTKQHSQTTKNHTQIQKQNPKIQNRQKEWEENRNKETRKEEIQTSTRDGGENKERSKARQKGEGKDKEGSKKEQKPHKGKADAQRRGATPSLISFGELLDEALVPGDGFLREFNTTYE